MRKVAVTGGIGSGKSTVCSFFKELGAFVVEADAIVASLLSPTTSIGKKIIQLLGSDVVVGKSFDKKKVAEKVFAKEDLLQSLEKMIHPFVFEEIERRFQQVNKEKIYPLFVVEVPLLYEVGAEKDYDCVVAVSASEEVSRRRYEQGKLSPDYEQRMRRQIPPKIKEERADFIIHNDGSLEELKSQVKSVFTQLLDKEL